MYPAILELPDQILGRKVPTDWAWWMKYVGTVLASDLTPEEQFDVILLNTFREIPQNEAGHFQGVLDFYFCGDPPRGDEPAPPERLLDWKKDALRIWGDFRVYAGIDLFTARMHWWQFMSIFRSLPSESQIKNAIYYRSVDMRRISDPKERERYADIKRAVALDPVDYEAEYDAAMARRDMCADSSFG